ncbi:MAG TPA: PA14 domain-containing protein [Armatimonadota bacterium]|jgi:hypothetical protein
MNACLIAAAAALVLCAMPSHAQRVEKDLSGARWSLWLDTKAEWQNDTLYLPPVDVKSLPVNLPTGGWEAMVAGGERVSVPGTVEEYWQDRLGRDYTGVSWWWTDFTLQAQQPGRRVTLHFASVRQRAEVFLNGELVGYDLIGNTPFDVDVTGKLARGKANRLAVRITDHGGNFTWYDPLADSWGRYTMPISHGFGGISGPVRVTVTDPVHIENIYVRNKPSMRSIGVDLTLQNGKPIAVHGSVQVRIRDAKTGRVVQTENVQGVQLKPGENRLTHDLTVRSAKLWDLDHPNLYFCDAEILVGNRVIDSVSQRFGFRWFGQDGVGKNAVFRLNGKRIVLRTAISWGFWPVTGLYPTPELARKQILTAKKLGLNMLNFHRCIGPPIVMDYADELGLLQYEEPGGYVSGGGDAFAFRWAREKLLRMVKRDRNHPSMVIYDMINEEARPPLPHQGKDMADAHAIDPTRIITFTSGSSQSETDPCKLHMLPYDSKPHITGWFDHHNAEGPGNYLSEFYKGPTDHYNYTTNTRETVYWGEEGSISTPPRLDVINSELTRTGKDGWDGAEYRKWYQAYADYLDNKGLRKYFPTVDSLTLGMARTQYYYHGRTIETVRMANVSDGFAVNGWESEIYENHSGIVDCWRNPKGPVDLIARYNRPVYVAVKVRNKVVDAGDTVTVDFHLVNEVNLRGKYELRVWLTGPGGVTQFLRGLPAKVRGGDVYGQPLVTNVEFHLPASAGRYTVHAQLQDAKGIVRAEGDDEILALDWKSAPVPASGAVLELDGRIAANIASTKGTTLPKYSEGLGKLDYILIGDADPDKSNAIPADALHATDGRSGLLGEYFSDRDLKTLAATRVDPGVAFVWGGPPADGMGGENFSVRWTGTVTPPETGDYTFGTRSDDGARLWVDGQLVIDDWIVHAPELKKAIPVHLEAGHAYSIKLEYFQEGGGAEMTLSWSTPTAVAHEQRRVDDILKRVREDGTTAVFLDDTERWARVLSDAGLVKYTGKMVVGDVWLGGNLFVRQHPLFKGLPVNTGLGWEYADLAAYSSKRYGLMLEGEQAIAGAVNTNEPRVSTTVCEIPLGKGRIVLSTLDIVSHLNAQNGGGIVARKLLDNYIQYAAKPSM